MSQTPKSGTPFWGQPQERLRDGGRRADVCYPAQPNVVKVPALFL
jgi:hypothetical protein